MGSETSRFETIGCPIHAEGMSGLRSAEGKPFLETAAKSNRAAPHNPIEPWSFQRRRLRAKICQAPKTPISPSTTHNHHNPKHFPHNKNRPKVPINSPPPATIETARKKSGPDAKSGPIFFKMNTLQSITKHFQYFINMRNPKYEPKSLFSNTLCEFRERGGQAKTTQKLLN